MDEDLAAGEPYLLTPGDDQAATDAGAVYLFTESRAGWSAAAKLTASDAEADDQLGLVADLSGSVVLAGAYRDDDLGANSGSAYLFDTCRADFNGDGFVDSRDVLAFLNAWASADPRADFDGNGGIDSRDVLAYLNAWASGC